MLRTLPAAIGQALRRFRASPDRLVHADPAFAAVPDVIQLASSAFVSDGPIPSLYTDDGDGMSPPVEWIGVPPEAVSLALLVEDADSPTPRPLVHAIVIGLPAADGGLVAGALSGGHAGGLAPPASFGRNSFLKRAWLPPDPPPAHGPHRYVFQVFALDRTIPPGTVGGRGALVAAIAGHVLASGTLTGTYERR